jgi:hypothetical protein
VIRWLNAAALGIVGDVRGRQFTTVVAPEDRRLSSELFAQKVAGTVPVTDAELVLVDAHVRAVLRALGVHSRLEAVALAPPGPREMTRLEQTLPVRDRHPIPVARGSRICGLYGSPSRAYCAAGLVPAKPVGDVPCRGRNAAGSSRRTFRQQ